MTHERNHLPTPGYGTPQPDIQWGYQDDHEPDPQKSARFFHVECKRLGGSELNAKYVDDGVMRFVSLGHRYGKDVGEGAMIGYLVKGQTSEALVDVNSQSAMAGLPAVALVSDGAYEGYSGEDVRLVANFLLAARLRERRPASRKDWVTTLSPVETGRACIIPPDSAKMRSSTYVH